MSSRRSKLSGRTCQAIGHRFRYVDHRCRVCGAVMELLACGRTVIAVAQRDIPALYRASGMPSVKFTV